MGIIRPAPKVDTAVFTNLDIAKSTIELCKELQQRIALSKVDRVLGMLHTQDPYMLKMKDRVRLIAYQNEPVLICGPTGTGKELLASACVSMAYSDDLREECPFVAINCGAIPKNLIQSMFFGHVAGAYTGAIKANAGLLQQAGRGIVFLDEIGELPLENQATLLRAIQEGEIYPVGSVKPVKIHCRFVAATKQPLSQMVEQGLFRDDLYARISVFRIYTTGLKDRPDDIPYIAAKLGYDKPLPDNSLEHIYKYNVRGIQAVIANMKVFGEWIPDNN